MIESINHSPEWFLETFAKYPDTDTLGAGVNGHRIVVTRTRETGFHTDRPRYQVRCASCDEMLHGATTGPSYYIANHVKVPARRK